MTTFRAGFLALAGAVLLLDAGFWWFARTEHQTPARIGFLVAFVLLLALLAATAGVVRWEVAAPAGTTKPPDTPGALLMLSTG